MDQNEHPITVAHPESNDDEVLYIFQNYSHSRMNLLKVWMMRQLTTGGIPGWETVDRLARALLNLEGLCVSNAQAEEAEMLHSQFLDYETSFQPRQVRQKQ